MRSSKLWLIGGILVAALSAQWQATQTWVQLSLSEGAAAFGWLDVTGQQLNQSLASMALAALAAGLVLTIAGPILRRVLSAVIALLGAGIAAIPIGVLNDPAGAAAGRLAEATGIAGSAQADLVTASGTTPFIATTLISGAALVALGVLVLILGARWRNSGRRYSAGQQGAPAPADDGDPDRIGEWDAQNEGLDPSVPGDAGEGSQESPRNG